MIEDSIDDKLPPRTLKFYPPGQPGDSVVESYVNDFNAKQKRGIPWTDQEKKRREEIFISYDYSGPSISPDPTMFIFINGPN